MKPEIVLPVPGLAFPEAGWRERFDCYVSNANARHLELEARLEAGAPPTALGSLPPGLEPLYRGANGGRIGHIHVWSLDRLDKARSKDASLPFAQDVTGVYGFAPGPHAVVLVGEEPGEEQRFTTVGTFLEAALLRAWAAALHRKAELDAGDDLDDGPWLEAAREAELAIDKTMLRTRED